MRTIRSAELFHVRLPLNFTFVTAKASLPIRETLIVKLVDNEGIVGFGECVSFTEPTYTKEILEEDKTFLTETYLPWVLRNSFSHPFGCHKFEKSNYPMAIAAVENALLDIFSKQQNKTIVDFVFAEKRESKVETGMVLGDVPHSELLKNISTYEKQGCRRFKLKISPRTDPQQIQRLIETFPQVRFLVDANQSFQLKQLPRLQSFDNLGLLCIEEPFAYDKMEECSNIQSRLATPICLDESIQTLSDLKTAYSLNLLSMLNVKIGKLGGLFYVKEAIEFCRQNRLEFWIGSMVESGISKILHAQLASLSDVCMSGDLSDSSRYFKEDLIDPTLSFPRGQFDLPTGSGLGVKVREKIIKSYTIKYWIQEREKKDEFGRSLAN